MKFFMPAAEDEEQAERVYNSVVKFNREQLRWEVSARRIFSIRWVHEGTEYYAEVGKPAPRLGEPVLAILESNAYLICTPSRGVVRGEPMLVGTNEVIHLVDFEPSE
jgi:hypothetical protein